MKKTIKIIGIIVIILLLLTIATGFLLFFLNRAQEGNMDQLESPERSEEVKPDHTLKENTEVEMPEEDIAVEEEEEKAETTLIFAGDVLLSSYVLNNYERDGITGVVAQELLDEMDRADIFMINQEFPFSSRGVQAPDKQFTFRAEPSYIKIFQEMGVDIVTLANNHSLDYGAEALMDSIQTVSEAGIEHVGAGSIADEAQKEVVFERNGYKIGFLAASRVIPVPEWNIENAQPGLFCTYDPQMLNTRISEVKKDCDFVIVYVHWGIEREAYPEDYQRTLAKGYIDSGADLIIGAHPHVLQGIEFYNDVPIIYSLGNYIFNQEIRETVLLKVVIDDMGDLKCYLLPAYAKDAKTNGMDDESKNLLYRYMEEISEGISIGEEGDIFQ